VPSTLDDDVTRTLSGTLHVTAGLYFFSFYSVYQARDLSVYIDSHEEDFVVDGHNVGMTASQSMSQSTIVQHGIVSSTSIMDVTFFVHVEPMPTSIVVVDMSDDNSPLARHEYEPGTLPSSWTPAPGTAYLILETHTVDNHGQAGMLREVYGHDATHFFTFAARADGICLRHNTDISW